jgi:plastocyanin
LVRWAAGALFVAVAAVGLLTGDTETIVIAALLLGANLLLRFRGGLLGTIAAALLAADIAFWLTPALVTNLVNGEGADSVIVPAVLAVLALVLLVAAVAALVRRSSGPAPTTGPAVTVLAGLAVVVVASALALLGDEEGPQPGDLRVDLEDTAFVPDEVAVDAGPTAFFVENHDLFWHTFTIEGTGVDVRLASKGSRRVEVDLAPGTYELVCRIPGHESVGMTGTVEVR